MGSSDEQESACDDAMRSERLVTQLTAIQGALYAYICILLGGPGDAADVLQETNLVLWRRAHEFDTEQTFSALAYKVAYFQVLAHRKKGACDRHVFNFSEESLETMAGGLAMPGGDFANRLRLLDECIEKLPDYQRELIRMRYSERLGVKTISSRLCKSENSISTALHRARLSLADCVETTPGPKDRP
jgi:RNA polymerase sigma-70 factor (ECF subfamily)